MRSGERIGEGEKRGAREAVKGRISASPFPRIIVSTTQTE